jgi:RNA polymerase sigma-70 factor (ECF subfamily)
MSALVSAADAASFHTLRPRLFGIACRVLGNPSDADDVVQDTWIRWQRTNRSEVRDATGFLVTATTRLAMTEGQSAHARRETAVGLHSREPVDPGADPSAAPERDEALELAVRALLEKLSPPERAVYVLREAFDYPYRDIAELLSVSDVNARQLLTRARRRLAAGDRRPLGPDEHRRLLEAFLAAAQTGAMAALEQVLTADAGRVARAA